MYQLLWIGSLENEDDLVQKIKKGSKVASGQVTQENLIKGIENASGFSMHSINGSILPPYPIYPDWNISEVRWTSDSGASNVSVGYHNACIINRAFCRASMEKEAKKWAKNNYKGDKLIVFVYGMRSVTLGAAKQIKKLIPSAKLYLIITDLPQYMDMSESTLKRWMKKLDAIAIENLRRIVDGYIVYTSTMAEYLKIPDGKWILMEGSYIPSDINKVKPEKVPCRAIMYSGRLAKQYGIPKLLDAFMRIPGDDLQLWLTGSGNCEEYISLCIQKDKRIKYYGFIPSRNDVLALQSKASVLVNMRLPSEPVSSYSFPSKLLEYMATEKPVLSFRLRGIPDEYFDYLLPIESENMESIEKAIEQALKMDPEESYRVGKSAAKFVKEKKSVAVQSERICHFIGVLS